MYVTNFEPIITLVLTLCSRLICKIMVDVNVFLDVIIGYDNETLSTSSFYLKQSLVESIRYGLCTHKMDLQLDFQKALQQLNDSY